ncbi:nicotinate phosphoribosyltransferase-like isoform X2 [Rhynchophorus ferrugineus]|uniref:nicotinate phosphoribosyltransferase-like isoform X2 n=1 Tax=Rhynchophorus ferrugineus TaxID=354439 RepID=UPI003FCEA90F
MNINSNGTNEELSENDSIIQPLLTDLYQITMAYAYWKSGKTKDYSVFDLFFRKNPFGGEFTIFAGLEECLKFLKKFRFSKTDLEYLKQILPDSIEESFFNYLSSLTGHDVRLYAIAEGSVVFPRLPLMRVEGPLIVVQLMETTFLNLVNFASLVATNAARFRIVSGNVSLIECGLCKAQGPDGGLSASKYSYIGGIDATSNVLAGKLFGIPVQKINAPDYLVSLNGSSANTRNTHLSPKQGGKPRCLLELTLKWKQQLLILFKENSNQNEMDDELGNLVLQAVTFPDGFMTLVHIEDIERKGLVNFCAVALALNDLGYRAAGIRLNSGDLAYVSKVANSYFTKIKLKYKLAWFEHLIIMASNGINEDTIISLNEQIHKINCFGIGRHLVTCQRQPALGCVFKMVELNNQPRMKLSQDPFKVTMAGSKEAYRLYSNNGYALVDLLLRSTEQPPNENEKILCRHPLEESKRAYMMPAKVEKLLNLYWENGQFTKKLPTLKEIKEKVNNSLKSLRSDIKRNLNPTPYKVKYFLYFSYIYDLYF